MSLADQIILHSLYWKDSKGIYKADVGGGYAVDG
jgi:hypothetical protein